jgi:RND family efflux transporter MFP subunit
MKKLIVTIIVLAGIGLLGWQVYQKASVSGSPGRHRRRSPAVAVEISPVKKASIREVGEFSGSLYALSEFRVAPKIAGRLEKILVNIGDRVTGNQLIAVLDDEEYKLQVSQAEAELEVTRANLLERRNILENAGREYNRTAKLRTKKIISESQMDAAESEYKTQQAKLKVANAQVSQKMAALEMAKVRYSYAKIRVPAEGKSNYRVVGERFVDEGAMLAPNTPIVSILDIGILVAVINVIERDYSKIKPGLETVITTDAYPGLEFHGRVTRIAPLLKEKSREARVEIEIPNEKRLLKPGMFVRVQTEFQRHENATVVPLTAIVKRNGTVGVFVVDRQAERARFVAVQLGIVNGTQAEILSPQLPDTVVSLGHHLLEDNAKVILPGKKARNGPPGKGDGRDSKRKKTPAKDKKERS